MTRGKHAAAAAKRREEAALSIAENLAEKNATLAHRARVVESEARSAPALRRRVAELEAQIEAQMTPKLSSLIDAHAEEVRLLTDALQRSATYLSAIIRNCATLLPDDHFIPPAVVEDREYRRLSGLVITLPGLAGRNRAEVRVQRTFATVGDTKETVPDRRIASFNQRALPIRVRRSALPYDSLADAARGAS